MSATVRFAVVVVGIVAIAAVVMVPRRDEWLAVMTDQRQSEEVIAMLEAGLARDENDPSLLASLGRSYAQSGNHQRATELLERYVALRPGDGAAYGVLADLFKEAGDQAQRTAMLERNVEIVRSQPRVQELAILYRQQGRADDEFALLKRFETELSVESGLVLRLAERLTALGDQEGAIRVLSRAEQSSPASSTGNLQERLLWAELLAKSGRGAEAAHLAKQWVQEWREPWHASQALRALARYAPSADASEIADIVVEFNPEIRLFLVHELAQMGAKLVANHLLEAWSEANASATMDQIAGFLTSCRELDEPGIVWSNFAQVLRRDAPEALKARFTEAIIAEFGIEALAPFWAWLPRSVLDRNPFLLAQLAFYEQNLPLTKSVLDRVDVAALSASDRQMWMGMLSAVSSPVESFEVLRSLHRRGGLPQDLLLPYARLAGALGQEIDYQAAIADLGRQAH